MEQTTRAHVALFVTNLIYGANYVVAKAIMPQVIGPSGFVALRVLGAALLFWMLRAFRPERVATGDMLRMLLCAVFGVAINQLMFFHGLMRTSPLHASILMVATPILVLVFASFWIRERVTPMKLIGVLLGAGGALMLIMLRDVGTGQGSSRLGDMFILVNATSFAIYLVIAKPLMMKYTAVTVTAWTFLIGSLIVTPFGLADLNVVQWSALTNYEWGSIFFVIVFVTFIAYLLNTWALRVVNPSVVGTYIYLQPVLATLFGWIFFELGHLWPDFSATPRPVMGFVAGLGAAAIFLGVHLVGRADARGK